ncbi:MAG: F0F1 ATP synthase subunit delta [Burkholderiaceae bacterium]|nr:F0F1 ATP synthase subunit delta [Sulfuritalea sp.]MCF8175518.1 F0F1 ATP synthase subunit delta [Burkholderiaceae bacterium]MCF8183394.1 F0F1 ATP synthase subunit delta [Polynucleobacter sp.]
MAENVTLARPYAEAAFQLAKSGNALTAWSDVLSRLSAVAARPEMEECIGNPRLSPDQLAKLCLEVAVSDSAPDLSADQQNFVRVLAENDRLIVLPEISELFNQLKHGQEGVRDAEITSAFALDEATLKTLVADLERKFESKIKVTVKVDAELIGGVRIAVGDEVIDASVRGKLAAMATALKN